MLEADVGLPVVTVLVTEFHLNLWNLGQRRLTTFDPDSCHHEQPIILALDHTLVVTGEPR